MKYLRLALGLTFISSLCLILAFANFRPASAAYNVSFANFWIGKVTPGDGHIGVDIWWNNGSGDYLPCQHDTDPYYDACALSNAGTSSYYKVMNYTSTGSDFPYGIFIDNQDPDVCTTSSWCQTHGNTGTVKHGWATLIADASLEIYPHISGSYNPAANTVGGVRIGAEFFNFANGGRYSPHIGDVSLPQLGQAGVGKLNGFATYSGVKVSANRLTVDSFQEQATLFTSTGYATTGFSSVNDNSDGYYSTGALPNGTYKIYVTDNQTGHKIVLNGVGVHSQYERLDFQLDQPCFGHSGSGCQDPAP